MILHRGHQKNTKVSCPEHLLFPKGQLHELPGDKQRQVETKRMVRDWDTLSPSGATETVRHFNFSRE